MEKGLYQVTVFQGAWMKDQIFTTYMENWWFWQKKMIWTSKGCDAVTDEDTLVE